VPLPAGEQFLIAAGTTVAMINEIGATLRGFVVDGQPIVWEFRADEMSSYGRGQVLAPWPNRLADGTYRFGSRPGKAPLDEPERGNAIHGFVRWLPFVVERLDKTSVRCVLRLGPQPAYPWWWRLAVTYSVAPGSLTVSTTFENLDSESAPFALGFHPYLIAGANGLDDSRVAIPAAQHLVNDERMIPIGKEPVAASVFSAIVEGLTLRAAVIDDAFSALKRASDGRWRARFWPDGERPPIVVWGDEGFTHVMCFTGDSLPENARRRALALEPMTAAPNALASGDGLRVVEPGASLRVSWGVALE
jgi:aldose 1-epimerase